MMLHNMGNTDIGICKATNEVSQNASQKQRYEIQTNGMELSVETKTVVQSTGD